MLELPAPALRTLAGPPRLAAERMEVLGGSGGHRRLSRAGRYRGRFAGVEPFG
jgi:hypothetical protein